MSSAALAFAPLRDAVVSHQDTFSGKVIRVIFRSEATGFSVVSVEGEDNERRVIKGTCPPVGEGICIAADGRWIDDAKFGRQLDASLIRIIEPTGKNGVIAYLASGVIFGIGPALARRIVDVFGEKTVSILDTESARLREVPGIGAKKLAAIRESWDEQKVTRELMVFLSSHGVSPNKATRIYKALGDQAERMVRENPYVLAHEVDGIGFVTADQIALKISPELRESEHRIGAGLVYVLEKAKADGHTCLKQPLVINEAVTLLQVDPAAVTGYMEKLLTEGTLEREFQEGEPYVYLPIMNRYERNAAKVVRTLALAPVLSPIPGLNEKIEAASAKSGRALSESQHAAVTTSATNRISVITGGPGVGKTYSLACLLDVLEAARKEVVLCAPTGRAAKRMSEATGRVAKTIHRTLAFNPRKNRFEFDEQNPLPGDVFIVDESSMLDIPIASRFLRALPAHASVVFIGDVDQLPSVGAGTFLSDLIESKRVPTVYLRTIFRQAAQSKIILAAHAINEGNLPESGNPQTDDFMFFTPHHEPGQTAEEWREGLSEKIVATISRLASERIPLKFGLDPMKDIMVLAPMRKGPLGVIELNRVMQDLLNPKRPSEEAISTGSTTLRPRDRVIQTRNNYQLGVFNGEVGFVIGRDRSSGKVRVRFEGSSPAESNEVEYSSRELLDLSLAYAMTVHRSQGSEFPAVIMPMSRSYTIMLARNLVYTGVTRGKKLVVMVGDKSALAMAVRNNRHNERCSGLLYRLKLP
jgi:exodeoxyribonuclease V alpha subunit